MWSILHFHIALTGYNSVIKLLPIVLFFAILFSSPVSLWKPLFYIVCLNHSCIFLTPFLLWCLMLCFICLCLSLGWQMCPKTQLSGMPKLLCPGRDLSKLEHVWVNEWDYYLLTAIFLVIGPELELKTIFIYLFLILFLITVL